MGINGIFAGVVGLLGVACYFLFQAYTTQVEQRVTYQVAAKVAEAEKKLQAEFTKENDKLLATHKEETDALQLQLSQSHDTIDQLRLTAERDAKVDPLGFGDDVNVRFARVFCIIEAGGDTSRIQTCRNAPAEAFTSDKSLFLTVTPELAERWGEECERGRDEGDGGMVRDFCEWSLTGFTPQGLLVFLSKLEDVAMYTTLLSKDDDALREIIDLLREGGTSSPKSPAK